MACRPRSERLDVVAEIVAGKLGKETETVM